MSYPNQLPTPADAPLSNRPPQSIDCGICGTQKVPITADGRLGEHHTPTARTCGAGSAPISAIESHIARHGPDSFRATSTLLQRLRREAARKAYALARTPALRAPKHARRGPKTATVHEDATTATLLEMWTTDGNVTASRAYAVYLTRTIPGGVKHLSRRGWMYLIQRLAAKGRLRVDTRVEPRDAGGSTGRVTRILPPGECHK